MGGRVVLPTHEHIMAETPVLLQMPWKIGTYCQDVPVQVLVVFIRMYTVTTLFRQLKICQSSTSMFFGTILLLERSYQVMWSQLSPSASFAFLCRTNFSARLLG